MIKSFNIREVFEIIDKRWNIQLHHPLHATDHILNPKLLKDLQTYNFVHTSISSLARILKLCTLPNSRVNWSPRATLGDPSSVFSVVFRSIGWERNWGNIYGCAISHTLWSHALSRMENFVDHTMCLLLIRFIQTVQLLQFLLLSVGIWTFAMSSRGRSCYVAYQ